MKDYTKSMKSKSAGLAGIANKGKGKDLMNIHAKGKGADAMKAQQGQGLKSKGFPRIVKKIM
jgi:hypothetical protein